MQASNQMLQHGWPQSARHEWNIQCSETVCVLITIHTPSFSICMKPAVIPTMQNLQPNRIKQEGHIYTLYQKTSDFWIRNLSHFPVNCSEWDVHTVWLCGTCLCMLKDLRLLCFTDSESPWIINSKHIVYFILSLLFLLLTEKGNK